MLMNSKFMHRNRNSITVDYGFRDQAAKFVDLVDTRTCMQKKILKKTARLAIDVYFCERTNSYRVVGSLPFLFQAALD